MARRRKVLIAAIAASACYLLWSARRRPKRSGLTAKQERFLRRATLLEAQQVPFYHLLAMGARRHGLPRLAVGYLRAMEVEAEHLRQLKAAGRRLQVSLSVSEHLGDRLGRLSGRLFAAGKPAVGLRFVQRIEQLAASEYSRERSGLRDALLQQLYLVNQVDEESHQAWAGLMLQELTSAVDDLDGAV